MGIEKPKKFLYTSIPLKWEHVVYLAFELARQKNNTHHHQSGTTNDDDDADPSNTIITPTIDMDGNQIGFKFIEAAGGAHHGVWKCAVAASSENIKVNIVFDGDERSSSKRASSTRSFKRELSRLQIIDLEKKITACIQNNGTEEEISELSSQLSTLQKYATRKLSSTFPQDVQDMLQDQSTHKISIICSDKFQADPIIAQRSITRESDIIWSSDSDFSVHNPSSVQIKEFKFGSRSSHPTNIILSTACINMAKKISSIILSRFPTMTPVVRTENVDNNNEGTTRKPKLEGIFETPESPVFEKEEDYLCRAIVAMAIGGDCWEKGQKLFGAASARKRLFDTTEESSHKKIPDTEKAVFNLDNLKPDVVREMTGFIDIFDLISFALIVCGGDVDMLTKKFCKLSWLEEWVLYFEFAYGRTHIRLNDYRKRWKICVKTIRKILKRKLSLIIRMRNIWPRYASLEEDRVFRNPDTWAEILSEDVHLVMHDISNLPIDQPSDAEFNRATHNSYYGGPCGKGGIFTQPCGWEGALELWTGSIGGSDYVRKAEILKYQEQFANDDSVRDKDGEIIPFVNVFDKGYRVILDCIKHGKQLCWQPVFMKSDKRYGRYATLRTAVVAYVRSGNERSVKHLKHSWFIVRGTVGQQFDLSFISDMWLAWGFQMNFMYDPVH